MRFSALHARVEVYGRLDTIENHYQLAKRFTGSPPPQTWREAKGCRPDYLEIGGVEVSARLMSAWYLLLWLKYLDQNPQLVMVARHHDEFHDSFAQPGSNSQAEAVRLYVKQGRQAILRRDDVQALVQQLRPLDM